MKTKAPLPYYGSDASVAVQLAGFLREQKHVTIPFAGGMSILPHLTARGIIANDLNGDAIHFYQVLSGTHGEKAKRELLGFCSQTLSHPSVLSQATALLEPETKGVTPAMRAWAYWAVCWIGRKGKAGTRSTGGTVSVRWTAIGGNNASRLQAAIGDLTEWAEHFKRCEWLCQDFRNVLSNVKDRVDCGVYVDPPWFGAGDLYRHSFEKKDHRELESMLRRFKNARVLVRYGESDEVRKLYSPKRWNVVRATSRTQSNVFIGELWITNKK